MYPTSSALHDDQLRSQAHEWLNSLDVQAKSVVSSRFISHSETTIRGSLDVDGRNASGGSVGGRSVGAGRNAGAGRSVGARSGVGARSVL